MNQVPYSFQFIPNRKWIFIFFLFFTGSFLQAQTDDFVNGTIVTVGGETLSVKMKPAKADKLAKGVSIFNDTTQEYTKLTAKNISYFKYNDEEYFAKPVDGKQVFMEKVIEGSAQLYTYTYKEEKGNKMVEVVDYYVEKKEDGKFKLMTKKTFKNDMSEFYSDNVALTDKIKANYYTYDEKEATVEEYNDWVAQGKPGKTWRKEDGNYTQNTDSNNNNNNSNNNTNNNSNNNNSNNSSTIYDGSKFGIDIPLMANYSLINTDNAVTQAGVRNSSNGFGYNLGIGLRWQLSKTIFWRNGLSFRTKRFHSNYAVTTDTTGSIGVADEYGTLHNIGIYSAMHLEFGNFILGGGIDLSFAQIYRADYSIKNSAGAVIDNTQNTDVSIIAQQNGKNKFNVQFDMNLILGYKFRIANGALNIKPIFQYTVPLVSLFDLPQIYQGQPTSFYNRTGTYGFLISLGVIVDIGFPAKPKPRSLLED